MFNETLISDLYKDAYGFRPSSDWCAFWKSLTDEEKQKEWDDLCAVVDEEIKRDQMLQDIAVANFEKRIADCMKLGAKTRDQAISWIVDSLNLSEDDRMYGGEIVCYQLDLPFSMGPSLDHIVKRKQ